MVGRNLKPASIGVETAEYEDVWHRFTDALREAGDVVFTDARVDSVRLRAEGLRYLTRVLSVAMDVGLEATDPAYPRLIRLYDTYRNLANCNPDCIYLYARVSPEFTYRIAGKRGTSLMFEIATMDADMLAYPAGKWLQTVSDFTTNADGGIEITLSADRRQENWVKLDETARWIYVRQYFYDWTHEDAAQLTIERLGAPYPAPPLAPASLNISLEQLTLWIPGWYRGLAEGLVNKFYAAPSDQLVFSPAAGGFAGISYGRGYFNCNKDQAVIVEFEPPADALYWSIQIGTHYWEALDWDLRQCSLNGHQAKLDSDGKFRGVIALNDPAIPNWLDPGGHERGLICCRVVRSASVPHVTLRAVPFAGLRDDLPKETNVITPEARQNTLYQRMLSVQRRYRE